MITKENYKENEEFINFNSCLDQIVHSGLRVLSHNDPDKKEAKKLADCYKHFKLESISFADDIYGASMFNDIIKAVKELSISAQGNDFEVLKKNILFMFDVFEKYVSAKSVDLSY